MDHQWTEAETEEATRRWKDGESASQIAAALGGGVSRSAVLGKLQWFYASTPDVGMTRGGIDWRTHYHEEILDCLAPAARHFRSHPQDVVSMLAPP